MRHARRGTTTLLALVLVLLLVSMGGAMLSVSGGHSRSARGHEIRLRCLAIASAGVHAAVAEINSKVDGGGDGLGTLAPTAYAGGTYRVGAAYDAALDEYRVVARGEYAGAVRTLEVMLRRPWYPIFRFGLFGDRGMTVLSGTATDSVDSALPQPVQLQIPTQDGDVGSNGPVNVQQAAGWSRISIGGDLFSSATHRDLIASPQATAVSTSGSLLVSGDVRASYGSIALTDGAAVSGNVSTGWGDIRAGGAAIGGTTDTEGPPVPELDFADLAAAQEQAKARYGGGSFNNVPFEPAPLPTGGDRVVVRAGETLVLGAGSHSFDSLEIREGGKLVVSGDAQIGVKTTFLVRNSGQVQLLGQVRLEAGAIQMSGTQSSLVAEQPVTLRSTSGEVQLAGQATFKAAATLAAETAITGFELAGVTFQGPATLAAKGTMEFKAGGTYNFQGAATIDAGGSVIFKEGSNVVFRGATVVDAQDGVDLRMTSAVTFAGESRVFAKNFLEIKEQNNIVATSPTNLWYFVWGDNPLVALKEGGTLYGAILAIKGTIDVKTQMVVYGALQGREVVFREGSTLHYDLAFGRRSDWRDLKYRVVTWRETGSSPMP